jgi:hypothetical protein
MRRALFHTVGILGVLAAWSPSVVAQPLGDYYAPYPRPQPYPPGYYLPPPNYAPPSSYALAPSYAAPPNYHALPSAPVPYYAPPFFHAPPPAGYYGAPAYGYTPPPAVSYAPPAPVLIPLRPRSCGKYRYWNGEYCADARYERPYLGPKW